MLHNNCATKIAFSYLAVWSSVKGIPNSLFELCSGPSSSSILNPSSSNPESSSGISVGQILGVTALKGTPGFGDTTWHSPDLSVEQINVSGSGSSHADSTNANFYFKKHQKQKQKIQTLWPSKKTVLELSELIILHICFTQSSCKYDGRPLQVNWLFVIPFQNETYVTLQTYHDDNFDFAFLSKRFDLDVYVSVAWWSRDNVLGTTTINFSKHRVSSICFQAANFWDFRTYLCHIP